MDEERKQELIREHEEDNSFYSEWLSDNIRSLRADFIEENFPDEFLNYCKKEFDEWLQVARLNNE